MIFSLQINTCFRQNFVCCNINHFMRHAEIHLPLLPLDGQFTAKHSCYNSVTVLSADCTDWEIHLSPCDFT